MADDKKYYYLKLKADFFDSDEMILLESMTDGYLYSNILLKLYLRSLKFQGKLMFSERIPYNPDILSKITRHSVGVIEKSLQIFKELGLIEVLDNGAIYMLDIQNFIGKSSTEADRIRSFRQRIDAEKDIQKKIDCSTNVQQMNDKSTPKIEIELDIDIDINSPLQDIFKHWNNCKIIEHKKLTDKMKTALSTALKDYAAEDIKTAISNYSEILVNEKYYFNYKWTLIDFLKRGLEKFLDLETAKNNYTVNKKAEATTKPNKFHNAENTMAEKISTMGEDEIRKRLNSKWKKESS